MGCRFFILKTQRDMSGGEVDPSVVDNYGGVTILHKFCQGGSRTIRYEYIVSDTSLESNLKR